MGDLLDTDVEPEIGKLLARSRKDAFPVAARVCALRNLCRRGWWGGDVRSWD
jgi:hypothetical protein